MVFTICKHIPWRFIILGTGSFIRYFTYDSSCKKIGGLKAIQVSHLFFSTLNFYSFVHNNLFGIRSFFN